MSCPVMHGSGKASPVIERSARDEAVALASQLSSVGCDWFIASYNVCQQKAARDGTGHCAVQAQSVLECEKKRRNVIRSVLSGGNSLVGAFDECAKKSTEAECLNEARAALSRAAREMQYQQLGVGPGPRSTWTREQKQQWLWYYYDVQGDLQYERQGSYTPQMKYRQADKTLVIPDGVTVEVKSRQVTVKGPRGTLKRDLRNENVEMEIKEVGGKKTLNITKWMGTKKQLSALQTFKSHVQNMIIGVTRGFRYKMRFVYAHFPINVNIEGSTVEVRNFLGEKRVRRIAMRGDTKVTQTKTVKDEIVLEGNDVEAVSQSAADIHRQCLVTGGKDLRKFLDGIFVSEGGPIPVPVA